MEKQEKEKEFDFVLNFLLVGCGNVGRSNILSKYICDKFKYSFPFDWNDELNHKIIEIEGDLILLRFVKPFQDDRYAYRYSMMKYLSYVDGIILIYDVTSCPSFSCMKRYYQDILRFMEKGKKEKKIPFILIGNKCDLEDERFISKEEGQEFADKLKIPFYEVSAKTGFNIDNAFLDLTEISLENLDVDENQIKYSIKEDFQKLFERKEFCDFEIECKDDKNPLNKIKIPVHKLIIQNRLKINENQVKNELYSILSQNSQKEVDILLKWIYFGKFLYPDDLPIFKEWKNKLSNICEIEFKIGIELFLKDLEILMNSEETKDFQIISNNQEIKVHKIILITRSELFREMFNISEDKSNSVHEYSNKKTETIQSLIHFFYTDNIPKIKKKKIYEELKECVDYFQLNSERLIQIIQKIEIEKEQKKNNCLIF
ncbi:rab/gtpase [Anaeramoeba ignava]|uniref:Rab/gtpase n=1 Tax=Anaeramoeba ignava TaxID=1746090 RepID=A0A9Q0LPK8_ANAIG|nr:rab/gtpase [Anaeramoeba ignava]